MSELMAEWLSTSVGDSKTLRLINLFLVNDKIKNSMTSDEKEG